MSDKKYVPLRTPRTAYSVAAWWPEGYGGVTDYSTEEEAMAGREKLMALGFKAVHVWKTTTEWIAR